MSDSLAPQCTSLKHVYDSCFNKWFEEYIEVVNKHKAKPNLEAVKAKGLELDTKCGNSFKSYRACIQPDMDDKGVTELLDEARRQDPLNVPPKN